jgi:hypothetical protein
MTVSRKTFLLQLVGGGWALAAAGCGGGDDYDSPAPTSCAATIAGNHGHVLAIPVADLNSTVARTYDILGTATHTHSVTFSAAQLAALKAGNSVTVTSTVTGSDALAHSHAISERCT